MLALHPRKLALALVQVIQMWSNPRYASFLRRPTGALEQEWFRWFVGSWKVARNIRDGHRRQVAAYLGHKFRKSLLAATDGSVVDLAAQHLKQKGWSSRDCLPISLCSKVAFFLCPEKYVPYDRYSVQGLNALRSDGGLAPMRGRSYVEYLEYFDHQYSGLQPLLKAALREEWAVRFARQVGCPATCLNSPALRRKLFDDYLMHLADYGV